MAGEMKKLTINGQSYTVSDPIAIKTSVQRLTEEEKAQARQNIGAMKQPEENSPVFWQHVDHKEICGIGFESRRFEDGQIDGGVYICADKNVYDMSGYYSVLEFEGMDTNRPVILRRVIGGGLTVTIDSNGVASATSEEIYAYIANGGTVILSYSGKFYSCISSDYSNALFAIRYDTGMGYFTNEYVSVYNSVQTITWSVNDASTDYVDTAIANAIANLPVYNGEVE